MASGMRHQLDYDRSRRRPRVLQGVLLVLFSLFVAATALLFFGLILHTVSDKRMPLSMYLVIGIGALLGVLLALLSAAVFRQGLLVLRGEREPPTE